MPSCLQTRMKHHYYTTGVCIETHYLTSLIIQLHIWDTGNCLTATSCNYKSLSLLTKLEEGFHMHSPTHSNIHRRTHRHTHTHARTHTHTHAHTHRHTHTQTHARTRTHTHVCITHITDTTSILTLF